jgi:uncharacterized protein DUF3617
LEADDQVPHPAKQSMSEPASSDELDACVRASRHAVPTREKRSTATLRDAVPYLTAPVRQAHISRTPVLASTTKLGDGMTNHWKSGLAAAGMFVCLAFGPARADAPGVLWQSTSQMVMEGMPFSPPPNTVKFCAARDSTQPPPSPPGQNCTVSNQQRNGNKVTWDTQCTGQMDMTGHGEITYDSDDSYTGVIELTAEGTTMKINLTGKKIGDCDKPIG